MILRIIGRGAGVFGHLESNTASTTIKVSTITMVSLVYTMRNNKQCGRMIVRGFFLGTSKNSRSVAVAKKH